MAVQTIPALDDIPEYPQRKDPQDRFDTLIKEAVDGGSKAVSELNTKFIPAYNSAVPVMNWIEQNKTEILAVDDNAASALASKNAAAVSATTATTKAGEAATSATAAKASETAALAAQKAAEASASTATTRAEEAASSASTALASKDAAKTSETAAAASASTASTKAGEASDSATAAKASETSALASAETAANSATVAQAAKAAAEAARDEAQDIANVGPATTVKLGLVKMDGKTTRADAGGVITVKDVAIGGDLGDLASARGQIGDSKTQGSHNFSSGMLSEKPGMYTAINSGSTNVPFTGPFAEMILGTPTHRGSLLITSGRPSLPRAAISAIDMTEGEGFSGYNRLITEQQVGDGLTVNNGIISVPEMQGATASTSGTSGLVPPATAGQQESFLTGGGEYKNIVTAPVGAIVMYPVDLPEPDGWLRCNGGTFEATEYPELALALNGTILPNSGRTVADIHFIDSGSGLKKWETLAVNPTSGDIWASTHGSGAQPVYVQRGGTGEWINMGALNSNYSLYSIAVEKISGDVWACGKNFVSVLRGGTGSWVTVNASLVTNRIINVVYFNGTNRHAIAYSVDKSLYWSLDNGETWKSQADMPFDASTVTWIGAYGNSQLMVASRSSIVFVDSVDSSIVQNPNLFGYGIYDDVNDMIYGYSIDEDVMNVVHKDPNYGTKIKVPMRFERSPIINPYNFDLIMPLSSVYGFPFMYLSNNKIQTFYAPYNKLIQFKGCAFCKENEIVFCGSTIDHPIYRMKLDLCQEIIKAK